MTKIKEKHKYIYKITNKINGKIYIGKTIKNIDERFKEHINESKKLEKLGSLDYNSRLYPAMIKYGCDNFYIELVEELSMLDNLDEKEQYYIKLYNSTDEGIGYNISPGGEGGSLFKGHKHTDETKAKLSKNGKGRKWYTNGVVDVMRFECPVGYHLGRTNFDLKGEKNPNYHKSHKFDGSVFYKPVQNIITGEIFESVNCAISVYGRWCVKQSLKYKCIVRGTCFIYINDINCGLNEEQRTKIYNEYIEIEKLNELEKINNKLTKQKDDIEKLLNKYNIDINEYIRLREERINDCPNKFLSNYYNIEYKLVRKINNFFNLDKGGSNSWASWLKEQHLIVHK